MTLGYQGLKKEDERRRKEEMKTDEKKEEGIRALGFAAVSWLAVVCLVYALRYVDHDQLCIGIYDSGGRLLESSALELGDDVGESVGR